MSALLELEKGDVIITKDGREMQVISIYKPDGKVRRCDCVAVGDESPMRTPVWSENIARILRKAPKPAEPEMKTYEGQPIPKDPVLQAVNQDVAKRQEQKKKEDKETS